MGLGNDFQMYLYVRGLSVLENTQCMIEHTCIYHLFFITLLITVLLLLYC